MKEIIAIIRMNKVNKTKKALADAGFPGIHAVKVMGRGKLQVEFSIIEELGSMNEAGEMLIDGLAQGMRLLPKRMLTILANDAEAEQIIELIIKNNTEGKRGDGKIFVVPLEDAVRIRTGECKELAI